LENRKIKILEPNKGKHIAVAGDINTVLAFKEDTGGTYSFIEAKVFPGEGPVPHIQTREHEGFYIIEGQIIFNVDEQRIKPNLEHLLISHQCLA
jgi:mannose-6-phosphate isomerase-like protein (cupin superfamily)